MVSTEAIINLTRTIIQDHEERLEELSITIIKEKISNELNCDANDFSSIIEKTVDEELIRLATPAIDTAVKLAVERAIKEVSASGRAPVKEIKSTGRQKKENSSVNVADEKLTTKSTYSAQQSQGFVDEDFIHDEPDIEHDNDNNDSDSLTDEPPKRRRVSGRAPSLIVDPLLAQFAGERDNLTPRQYAELILDHCKKEGLEVLPGKRAFKTDVTLKSLLKNRATVSKFPNKIIEALKYSKMLMRAHLVSGPTTTSVSPIKTTGDSTKP